MRLKVTTAGRIVGVRYARDKRSNGEAIGALWSDTSNTMLVMTRFHNRAANGTGMEGWEHAYFAHPWVVAANDILVVAVGVANFRYLYTVNGLVAADVVSGSITALRDNVPAGKRSGTKGFDINAKPPTNTGGDLPGIDILFLPN